MKNRNRKFMTKHEMKTVRQLMKTEGALVS